MQQFRERKAKRNLYLVKTASRTPTRASSAGTNEPTWARIAIKATYMGRYESSFGWPRITWLTWSLTTQHGWANILIHTFGSIRSFVYSAVRSFVRSFIRSLVPPFRLMFRFVSFNRTFTPVVRSFGGSLFSSFASFDSLFFSFALFRLITRSLQSNVRLFVHSYDQKVDTSLT